MKKISDVIRELAEIQQEHGDIEVIGVGGEEIAFEAQDEENDGNWVLVAE